MNQSRFSMIEFGPPEVDDFAEEKAQPQPKVTVERAQPKTKPEPILARELEAVVVRQREYEVEAPRASRGVEAVEELDPFFTEVPDEPFGKVLRKPKVEDLSWSEIWAKCPRWVRWGIYLIAFRALIGALQ